MKREILVLPAMNNQDGEINGGGQPHGAHRIQPEPIENIHPQDHHGSKNRPKKTILIPIKAEQGLPGARVTSLQEEKPNLLLFSAGGNDCTRGADGMAVEQDRFADPIHNRFNILGKPKGIHETIPG